MSHLKLLWDDDVTENIKSDWRTWLSEIVSISKFEFPRCIIKNNAYNFAEMHIFADSSRDAYSVIYFGHFIYSDNKVAVEFPFGKCKVCPIGNPFNSTFRIVTAAMATRISKSIAQESNINFERTIYWSDSLSTLHLIRNNTKRFCVFVDACLAEIRDSSHMTDWWFCPSNQNPADVGGSRIIMQKNSRKFLPWFKGPSFLLSSENNWPKMPFEKDQIVDVTSLFVSKLEIKPEVVLKNLLRRINF